MNELAHGQSVPSTPAEDDGTIEKPKNLIPGDIGYVASRVQEWGLDPVNPYAVFAQSIEDEVSRIMQELNNDDPALASSREDAVFVHRAKLELARKIHHPIGDFMQLAKVQDRLSKGLPLNISYPDHLNATGGNSG